MSAEQTKPLSLKEVGTLLVKHYGIHDGIWGIAFGINIGVGQFGPTPQESLPGAMFGISNVSLLSSEKEGPNTVDAAEVNPAQRSPIKSISTKKAAIKK